MRGNRTNIRWVRGKVAALQRQYLEQMWGIVESAVAQHMPPPPPRNNRLGLLPLDLPLVGVIFGVAGRLVLIGGRRAGGVLTLFYGSRRGGRQQQPCTTGTSASTGARDFGKPTPPGTRGKHAGRAS